GRRQRLFAEQHLVVRRTRLTRRRERGHNHHPKDHSPHNPSSFVSASSRPRVNGSWADWNPQLVDAGGGRATVAPVMRTRARHMPTWAAMGRMLPTLVAGSTTAARAPNSSFDGATIDEPAALPDFALRDQHGRRIELGAQRGKLVLLTFLYTHCPDV